MKHILTMIFSSALFAGVGLASFDSPNAKINCGEFLKDTKQIKTCTDLVPATKSCNNIATGDVWMDEIQEEMAYGTETDYPEDVCPLFTETVNPFFIGDIEVKASFCCGS